MGGTVIPAGSDQMLGSTFAIWNDNIDTAAQGISEVDNFERFEDALPILCQAKAGAKVKISISRSKRKSGETGRCSGKQSVL